MSNEQHIEDLLVTWEDHWRQGRSVSAEELCGDRPEVVDQLRGRIQALQRMYAALAQPTMSADDTVPAGPAEDWPSPEGFECLEFLGQGGAGVVYKAWQGELSRFVALKIIREGGRPGRQRLDRFRAEAKAAQLQHPNIVQTYDIGECRGTPYLALEYLDGGTLAQSVDGAPQSPRDAARLVQRLAAAVHYAHTRGIVHRDLKPANILLKSPHHAETPADESLDGAPAWTRMTPKIADFGIARFLDQPSPITRTGDVMGTPAYMAPEQAEGRIQEIGAATDIHALGIILYELLTGRPPFARATNMETLNELRQREAPPPSREQPGIPADLETICLKCLEKEPHQRYATAAMLADDLGCFLRGFPVSARPIGRAQRIGRWCRRNPVVAALAACLMVATVSGFALVTWKWIEADRARRRADANFAAIRRAVDDYLVIISEDVLLDEPAMQPLRERLLTTALDYYEGFLSEHGGAPELAAERARILFKAGMIKRWLGSNDESERYVREAVAEQQSLVRNHPGRADYVTTLNEIQNELAGMRIDAGDLDGAERLLEELVGHGRRTGHASAPAGTPAALALAKSHYYLGFVHARRGETARAAQSYDVAVALARQCVAADPADTRHRQQLAQSLIRLGSMAMELADHERAGESIDESIAVYGELVDRQPRALKHRSGLSDAHVVKGRLLTRQRRWDEAIAFFERAVDIQRQLIDENPQVVGFRQSLWSHLVNFAVALRMTRLDRALEYQREAIALGTALYDEYPELPGGRSLLAITYNNLGAFEFDRGHGSEAASAYEQAAGHLEALVEAYPDDVDFRARLVLSYTNLGTSLGRTGENDRALEYLRKGAAQGRIVIGAAPDVARYHHRVALALESLADLQCDSGETIAGRANLDEAIAILEQASERFDATINSRAELARFYLNSSSIAVDMGDNGSADRSLTAGRRLLDELLAHRTTDPGFRFLLAKSLFAVGRAQTRKGDHAGSVTSYDQALEVVESLAEEYPGVVRYRHWLAKTSANLGSACQNAGQADRARGLLERAIRLARELNAPATVTQPRRDLLAIAHLNLGVLDESLGQADLAAESYRRAIGIWQSVLDLSEMTSARIGLVAAHGNLGHIDYARDEPGSAVEHYGRAVDQVESILRSEPAHDQARRFKQNTLWGRARALNKLKRYDEAADDWQQVLDLTPPASQRLFRMELAWSQAKAGDHTSATALADALAAENADQPGILVNCARLYALALAAVERGAAIDPERREALVGGYEARCLELLEAAADAKHFAEPGHRDLVTKNADFDAMQSRPRFQEFLARLGGRK